MQLNPTNSNAESDATELLLTIPRPFSNLIAFGKIFKFASPYVISRLAAAALGITNALVISALDADSIAAAPLITAIQFTVIGTAMGVLQSVAIEGGELNGGKKFTDIGKLAFHGWLLSTAIGIIALGVFLDIGRFLSLLSVNREVAHNVQIFFNGYMISVIPFLWFNSDQHIAMAIKKSHITMMTGIFYSGLVAAIGYPLALGKLGLPKLGIEGLGIGYAASGWLNFFGLRAFYFFHPMFAQYKLFVFDFQSAKNNIKKLLKLGIPLGIQRFAEWGNIMILSLFLGTLGKQFLVAAQPALQIIYAMITILMGIAQATGVYIANLIGEAKEFLKAGHRDLALSKTAAHNARMIGHAAIFLSLLTAMLVALPLFAVPHQIVHLFIGHHADAIRSTVAIICYLSAVALLFDSMRIGSSGALRGYKDVVFSPAVSIFTMSVIGLPLGYLFSVFLKWNVDWLFVTRSAGIGLAALAIGTRWMRNDYSQTLFRAQEPQTPSNAITPTSAYSINVRDNK